MPIQSNPDTVPRTHQQIRADADVAVIGGGVVGCAVARRLTLEGASVVLLEKAPDILDGASKGNSAILHTGFDAPPGTLEWKCVQEGHQEYLEIHKSLNLPLLKTGAMVVAWSDDEEKRLATVFEKGIKNGVDDLRMLNRNEILQQEPNLDTSVRAAIYIPREYVIDPWSAPLAYLLQAVENGGKVLCDAEVTDGSFDGHHWVLETPQGLVKSRHVINCAGLYADIVDQRLLGESDFTIMPRKGQFVVFDKAAANLIHSVILPVPSKRTKGIVLFPTIFGNMMVGPTAEDQKSRDDASVDTQTLSMLAEKGKTMLPGLADIPVTATYAGIRPATEESPYRIKNDQKRHWITLGGIRSTGLTAALGLARHVYSLLREQGAKFIPLENPRLPQVPNLAEHLPRDYHTPGFGEIVCHCEMVTSREINAALNSKLPAHSLSGLKRRTRVTMGRCQGFYCSARLAEITRGKFRESLGVGKDDV
ncbi:MAG TPA: FAD/NAD(P)-binding oxidoreductase [Desulfobulbaceae bacterium]|nr:FAD/NAD(P)-binding oxidoreductase [Desulfobulbaceae bacterium]